MNVKMMKMAILAAGATLGLGGCITVQTPALGVLYTDVKYGDTATPAAGALKTGKACAKSVLGAVAWGDASIDAAKAAGGITTVASVDHTSNNYVGVYGVWCTVVKGQ